MKGKEGNAPSMIRRQRLVRLSVSLLSILIALVAVEFLLRTISKHSLHFFDVEMWRYAHEVKRESVLPGVVEEHRPNAESELMGVRIRTDSSGFRRPDPETENQRKPSNRLIVALGDSLTLGWGVPEGQTYPAILEKLLNQSGPCKATVLNAGIGNSNTSMELARYEHGLQSLHPDWLILGFFVNDAEPDPKPVQSRLVRYSALADLLAVRWMSHVEGSHRNFETYYRGLYEDTQPGFANLQSALAKLGQDLQRDNVRATILLLPEMHEPKDFGTFRSVYQRISNLAVAAGFEVIDASRDFPAGPGRRFWVSGDDAHPDGEAQQIFATALTKSKYAATGDCKR